MRSTVLALVLALLSTQATLAQCTEEVRTRVLLVGDSWAFFMWMDGTVPEVLRKWGHTDADYYTNAVLSENGAETPDFLLPAKLNEIQARLDANPGIDVVHLSIGGNDVLGDWHVDFTPQQTDSIKQLVYGRVLELIDLIKAMRPGIHILWSGYNYPNFQEVITDLGPLQTLHPFYSLWNSMGQPTAVQLNTILNDFSAMMVAYAGQDPQVHFVDATGLMQYTFGQNTPLGVPPGGTYPPYTVDLPHGLVDYPSPKSSMRNYGLTRDCFHLSAQGYRDLIDHHARKFYHRFLMHDHQSAATDALWSGSVSSTGTVASTVRIGRQGTEQFAALVGFDVSAAQGHPLAAAHLYLRREVLSGADPTQVTWQVKVRSGHFGAGPQPEAADYYFTAHATANVCMFKDGGGAGHWLRLELPGELWPHITATGTVQFLINAPGAGEGLLHFSGSDDPELAPVLDIGFAELPTAVPEAGSIGSDRPWCMPNPTTGMVWFDGAVGPLAQVEVFDVLGRRHHAPMQQGQVLDISMLVPGTYLLRAHTQEGRWLTTRMVKE